MNTERLSNLAISDTGFIFDPATGQSYSTNAVGIDIIHHLKSGKDPQQILDVMMETYDHEVSGNDLEGDIADFMNELKNYSLINNG